MELKPASVLGPLPSCPAERDLPKELLFSLGLDEKVCFSLRFWSVRWPFAEAKKKKKKNLTTQWEYSAT